MFPSEETTDESTSSASGASAEALLVGCLTALEDELPAEARHCAWLEVRADLVGDVDVDWLRQQFSGRLLYTLRSREEGGAGPTSPTRRAERLVAASRSGFDAVDLEFTRDASEAVLREIAPQQRWLSWHGGVKTLAELRGQFEACSELEAKYYKLVPAAVRSGDEISVLELLDELGRSDVAAFCTGAPGSWTRLVAPRLGAPLVYGALGSVAAAPGQLSIERLVNDYGLPTLRPASRLFGVVGNPVAHSLSPRIHNGLYREHGFPGVYVAFEASSFADFWLEVVESDVLSRIGLPLSGLSVTTPFKDAALATAGASSPLAQRIGSANTLTRAEGVWEAETSDPRGVFGPLSAAGFEGASGSCLVVGCGGAGRAAVAGLERLGSAVHLTNRTSERGRDVAARLGIPFVERESVELRTYRAVVNATSLGSDASDPLPFDVHELEASAYVVDLVYRDQPTPLEAACEQRGLRYIGGREVLAHQAFDQARSMTGIEASADRCLELSMSEGGLRS